MEILSTTHLTAEQARSIRMELGLKTSEFAKLCGVNVRTVERWENGQSEATGTAATLLMLLHNNPDLKEQFVVDEKIFDLRVKIFWRAFPDIPVCVIDVNEEYGYVELTNLTRRDKDLPFKGESEITFEEYEEFIKSLCTMKKGSGTILNPIEELKRTGGNSDYKVVIEEKE